MESSPPKPRRKQSGLIPTRTRSGTLEVLLVTSMTRKRWIIPKGNIEAELGPRETARLEAYEEAGVEGKVSDEPIGTYIHENGKGPRSVEVYVMEVERVLPDDEWPESRYRKRQWMDIDRARQLILEADLGELLGKLARGL